MHQWIYQRVDSVQRLLHVMMVILLFVQAFELATGDYLFEPHSGEDYSRDEGNVWIFSSCPFSFLYSFVTLQHYC